MPLFLAAGRYTVGMFIASPMMLGRKWSVREGIAHSQILWNFPNINEIYKRVANVC